ncbi:MAG: TIGR02452 family protein [Bacteroidales bacterium]|nr:TIGR02452 family protein [Bacteroidales bacterium]MBQ9397443.1 TIGR02452 family protein [Bacteroidales bacterium]
MDKKQRIAVFQENLELFKEGYYETSAGKRIRLHPAKPEYYDVPFELEPEPPVPGGTVFEVVNEDCIAVTGRLKKDGYNVAVLNMASLRHPGGGVENGAGAQEEQLCRRSNLIQTLYQVKYPMHPRFGGIYSPAVVFFREGEDKSCTLSDIPFTAAVISVAAISHPRLDINGRMFEKETQQTKDKIRTILRIGLDFGHDALVLGALGCGAYANPPAQVAHLFHEVFEEPEFKDQYRKIVFAILEDRNSRLNSAEGNYIPFKKEFATT